MSQILLALTVGRIAERLLVTGGALLAMFFGWQLFNSGVVIQQSAEGEFKGARIVLSKVGPGVFFALFSTIVLVYSLRTPLRLGKDEVPLAQVATEHVTRVADASQVPQSMPIEFQYLGPDEELNFVRAVNAIRTALADSKERRVKQALSVLEARRLGSMTRRLPAEDIQFYLKNADKYHLNPNVYPPTDQRRLEAVDAVATAEFDD